MKIRYGRSLKSVPEGLLRPSGVYATSPAVRMQVGAVCASEKRRFRWSEWPSPIYPILARRRNRVQKTFGGSAKGWIFGEGGMPSGSSPSGKIVSCPGGGTLTGSSGVCSGGPGGRVGSGNGSLGSGDCAFVWHCLPQLRAVKLNCGSRFRIKTDEYNPR